jgi:hypothetical protein
MAEGIAIVQGFMTRYSYMCAAGRQFGGGQKPTFSARERPTSCCKQLLSALIVEEFHENVLAPCTLSFCTATKSECFG